MNTYPSAGPRRVQIQTQAGCNGRCVFCPNEAVLRSQLEHGRMAEPLFHKIIDELAETRPERIMMYLQNEPLNNKRMPDWVRHVADRIPETTTLVTTNGTALTPEMSEALIDAGLKRIKVSLQSLDDETNRRIMGYGADKVVQNILECARLIRKKRSRLDLRVSMIVHANNPDEVDRARQFWKKNGVRLVTSALENRGGNIENAQELNAGEPMRPRSDCIRPFREMCILFNGQVVLCCVDWFRTVILGDVSKQSIQEVWHGPVIQGIREGFERGDALKLPPICRNCTESATPGKHRLGWKRLLPKFMRAR